jgi:hypothetical protein
LLIIKSDADTYADSHSNTDAYPDSNAGADSICRQSTRHF